MNIQMSELFMFIKYQKIKYFWIIFRIKILEKLVVEIEIFMMKMFRDRYPELFTTFFEIKNRQISSRLFPRQYYNRYVIFQQ